MKVQVLGRIRNSSDEYYSNTAVIATNRKSEKYVCPGGKQKRIKLNDIIRKFKNGDIVKITFEKVKT